MASRSSGPYVCCWPLWRAARRRAGPPARPPGSSTSPSSSPTPSRPRARSRRTAAAPRRRRGRTGRPGRRRPPPHPSTGGRAWRGARSAPSRGSRCSCGEDPCSGAATRTTRHRCSSTSTASPSSSWVSVRPCSSSRVSASIAAVQAARSGTSATAATSSGRGASGEVHTVATGTATSRMSGWSWSGCGRLIAGPRSRVRGSRAVRRPPRRRSGRPRTATRCAHQAASRSASSVVPQAAARLAAAPTPRWVSIIEPTAVPMSCAWASSRSVRAGGRGRRTWRA